MHPLDANRPFGSDARRKVFSMQQTKTCGAKPQLDSCAWSDEPEVKQRTMSGKTPATWPDCMDGILDTLNYQILNTNLLVFVRKVKTDGCMVVKQDYDSKRIDKSTQTS
ncbi:hypothetical protein ATANTOWER_000223 [Ataeniobius toweri]|uniref:Uncharacterized protein n=1 Tax=Ataeniobius toweri TaxID=208326 RepID=A0ABU7CE51_9TELE|nr:hypothetical protein [Ataeniobius toweri]